LHISNLFLCLKFPFHLILLYLVSFLLLIWNLLQLLHVFMLFFLLFFLCFLLCLYLSLEILLHSKLIISYSLFSFFLFSMELINIMKNDLVPIIITFTLIQVLIYNLWSNILDNRWSWSLWNSSWTLLWSFALLTSVKALFSLVLWLTSVLWSSTTYWSSLLVLL
jgi:hypothetical protein